MTQLCHFPDFMMLKSSTFFIESAHRLQSVDGVHTEPAPDPSAISRFKKGPKRRKPGGPYGQSNSSPGDVASSVAFAPQSTSERPTSIVQQPAQMQVKREGPNNSIIESLAQPSQDHVHASCILSGAGVQRLGTNLVEASALSSPFNTPEGHRAQSIKGNHGLRVEFGTRPKRVSRRERSQFQDPAFE